MMGPPQKQPMIVQVLRYDDAHKVFIIATTGCVPENIDKGKLEEFVIKKLKEEV